MSSTTISSQLFSPSRSISSSSTTSTLSECISNNREKQPRFVKSTATLLACDDLGNSIMDDSSAVLVPMTDNSNVDQPNRQHHSIWKFHKWIRSLPKLALLHLLSTTTIQQPAITYQLLEYQYLQDITNIKINTTNKKGRLTFDQTKPIDTCNGNMSGDMDALLHEMTWIQNHARAIVHLLDHARPNEQFARAEEINDQLFSLVRLCTFQFHVHWGDSFIALMALTLVAKECFDAPSEVRQCLFYRVKFGRTLILEMITVLKHWKIYRGNKTRNGTVGTTTSRHQDIIMNDNSLKEQKQRRALWKHGNSNALFTTSQSLTPQQQHLIKHFFLQRGSISANSGETTPHHDDDNAATQMRKNGLDTRVTDLASEWYPDLHLVCEKLAKMDEHWKYREEYQQVPKMAHDITWN
ncbi:uncharacterized protein BX664DRAFT_344067 [Halteromyces radiatus]|uniref:uncharacterized protein n=1 Tax=Halteromyces radiatus TaxID=101107 RepID=UPI002221166F|nr:uncharacterized protein BX664DRAFT_344067 [Halteromyces radiatus]KAI8076837.1 hypothetical protein BX664DRAFT_344067 [Halteromyces radiatus]